uniref:Glycosyltransferase family 92 protein n=1 Tax=Panagrellus redivivus TaxID=6233 RepID=A0A7E4ZUA3_PANRE
MTLRRSLSSIDCRAPQAVIRIFRTCTHAFASILHVFTSLPSHQTVVMWSSRPKLTASAVGLLLTLVILNELDLPDYAIPSQTNIEPEWHEELAFSETFVAAKEEIEFLHQIVLGRPEVDPVVEKTQQLKEVRICRRVRYMKPVIVAANKDWVQNGQWWLYSAHVDRRENSLFPGQNSVQILVETFGKLPPKAPVCMLWYGSHVKAVEAVMRPIWQRAWDPRNSFYQSILVTCGLPDDAEPIAVSLTVDPCLSTVPQAVAVQSRRPTKSKSETPSVAVCLKGLELLEDETPAIVEWIQFQLLMAADKVVVYVYTVPDRLNRALSNLAKSDSVEVINLTLPAHSPSTPFTRHNFIWRNRQQKRRHELIPYNDCFYRFSQTHDFVLIADYDEFVVPLKDDNYPQMLKRIRDASPTLNTSSLAIRNVFRLKSFGANESALLEVSKWNRRSAVIQDKGISEKSFASTKTVASVFNHFALHRLHAGVTRTQHVDPEIALKLHFKSACPSELGSRQCEAVNSESIVDTSIDRFLPELEKRVTKVMAAVDLV